MLDKVLTPWKKSYDQGRQHIKKQSRYFVNKDPSSVDTILKSRDVTLSTKIHLVKAMVFPVVMYGCESWAIKKADHQRLMLLNCGVGEDVKNKGEVTHPWAES